MDLLSPELEDTLVLNAVFASATPKVREAFLRRFVAHPITAGLLWERGQPPLDRLLLLGVHSLLDTVWEDGGWQSTTQVYYADIVGAQFFLPASPPPPPNTLLRASARCRGQAWAMSGSDLDALRTELGADVVNGILVALCQAEWTLGNPILASTYNLNRIAMSRVMVPQRFAAGEVLFDGGSGARGIYLMMPGSRVEVCREGSGTRYALGFGALFVNLPGQGCAPACRVTAVQECVALVLSQLRVDLILHNPMRLGSEDLENLIDYHRTMGLQGDAVVAGLQANSRLFRGLPAASLYPLLQAAVPMSWRTRFTPPSPIGDRAGVSVVVEGEILSFRPHFEDQEATPVHVGPRNDALAHYCAGDVLGEFELVTGDAAAAHWTARVPSQVVFIPGQTIEDYLGNDPSFQATFTTATAAAAVDRRIQRLRAATRARRAQLVWVGTAADEAWTPGFDALMSAAMQVIHHDFRESSRMVEVVPAEARPPSVKEGPTGWIRVTVRPEPGGDAVLTVARSLVDAAKQAAQRGISNLFVRVDPGLPPLPQLAACFDRMVFFEPDIHHVEHRPLPTGVPLVFVALLPPSNQACEGVRYPAATVRLRIPFPDLDARARGDADWSHDGSAVLGSQPPGDNHDGREADFLSQVRRLARGLTDRRVGLALSGGEGWGFGHYAVLGALHYRSVPIDVISGASVGAVIGAYYNLFGLDGLRAFIDARGAVMGMSILSMGTSTIFMDYLDRAFQGSFLEGLDRQLIPVATNIQMSCPEPVLGGNIAWSCRLSGSLVPAYAATPTDRATFLDGAFSDNLPVEALRVEGVRLILASNVMSPTRDQDAHPPALPGRLGRVLSDLNPLRRIEATQEGALTLAFAAGGASGTLADRCFQLARIDVSPFNLLGSPKVVHRALAQPSLWDTIRGIELRWQELCQPRHGIDPDED